ncbi:MAG: AI-2E family transporter [Clostridia bacterium]|nr:AI-2E family transporter [Clostridia bacterium]
MMKFTKENIKSIIFIAFCIILIMTCFMRMEALIAILGFIFGILTPVIVGFCIAFILNIPVMFFEKRLFFFLLRTNKKGVSHPRFARLFSVILTLVLFAGAVSLLLFFIIPQIADTITIIISGIPAFTERAIKFSQKYLNEYGVTPKMISDLLLGGKNILTTIGDFFKSNIGSVLNFGSSVLSGVVNAVLGIFIATYFMFDKEKVLFQLKRFFRAALKPTHYSYYSHVVSVSSRSFSNFISGQVLEAFILGTLCFFGMLIFRMPYALVVSAIISISALVPILGAWVGAVVGFSLILINDPVKALWFVLFIVILQQLEGNLIYPRVVGKQVGLPGVWVLLAIVIGTGFMGVIGALVAVPLASVAYTLVAEFVVKKEQKESIK